MKNTQSRNYSSKYLITGASGFIGQWLQKEIPNSKGIDSKDADIRDYNAIREVILKNKPTHIIHLAAIANPETCTKNPKLAWEVNVKGTENVLRVSKEENIKTAIMSTCQIYKETGQALKETDTLKTTGNTYIQTKIECEKLAREYNAIIIRAFNQEGPGRPAEYFTSIVINACINKTKLDLWNPYQTREYMDVRDGTQGIHKILQKGKGTYNLSTGKGINRIEYIKLVEETLKKEINYTITKDENSGIIIGDNTRLIELGWTQNYSLKQTILDQAKTLTQKKNEQKN